MPNAQTIFDSKYNNIVSSVPLSLESFGFTTAQLRQAQYAHIVVETAAIRYGFGFHAIDADNGKLVSSGDEFAIEGATNLMKLMMVADGSDAIVHVDIAS